MQVNFDEASYGDEYWLRTSRKVGVFLGEQKAPQDKIRLPSWILSHPSLDEDRLLTRVCPRALRTKLRSAPFPRGLSQDWAPWREWETKAPLGKRFQTSVKCSTFDFQIHRASQGPGRKGLVAKVSPWPDRGGKGLRVAVPPPGLWASRTQATASESEASQSEWRELSFQKINLQSFLKCNENHGKELNGANNHGLLCNWTFPSLSKRPNSEIQMFRTQFINHCCKRLCS